MTENILKMGILCEFTGVPLPPSHKLTVAEIFDARTGKPNHERLKQHFVQEGRIEESAALKVIQDGATLLRTERTMIDIEAPVTGMEIISVYINHVSRAGSCSVIIICIYSM